MERAACAFACRGAGTLVRHRATLRPETASILSGARGSAAYTYNYLMGRLPRYALPETDVMDSFDAPAGLAASPQVGARIVTVLLFAQLREALGTARETLALPDEVRNVGGLLDWLRARGDRKS